jgi:hypothetical protein
MVDMIIAEHGRDAIARIAAAYRDGASDAEAIQAGTGAGADTLYAAFYDEFGVDPPQPVEPAEILPSNVRLPDGRGGTVDGGPDATASPGNGGPTRPAGGDVPWAAVAGVVIVLAVAVGGALLASRRARAGNAG